TVGEMPGVNVEEAKLYTGVERNELQMVFHFEHVGLGDGQDGKWNDLPWKLTELKKIFTKWQEGLEDNGWNSLYWSNHDQPRAVSRFGNDHRDYQEKSAKRLATCLHMLKGTPYIYQGEEIGMTNAAYANIEDYRDIESLNVYQEWHEHEDRDHEQLMKGIRARSRDNARTPMQWNTEKHAGFTNANPWLKVNPNYCEINVESQVNEPDSIFHYYKKLIALRKQYEIIVYGRYELLQENDENVYFYRRVYGEEQLYVACNFSDLTVECHWPDEINPNEGKRLIGNYSEVDTNEESCKVLKPYEAVVYYFNHR
ncbi:MAG TPA: alpha-amylase family glycosyl hydrolase, partial [Bacillales bacterium]|nr:alpha-amylase family glycosyl hydrolase [Bacillales bacterium]